VATNDNWTLEELQDFINEAGDFHDPGFPDTLLAHWINSARQKWADFCLEMDDSRFLKEGTIAVVAGTETYDLKDNSILTADDYYRARGFCAPDSSSPSGYQRLDRFKWADRHDHSYSSHPLAARWDVLGDLLYVWPKPTGSGTHLLEYVPLQAKLVSAADTADLRGGVDFIVTYVCRQLSAKDESSLKEWGMLHEEAKRSLRSASPQNIAVVKQLSSVWGRSRYRDIRRMRRQGT